MVFLSNLRRLFLTVLALGFTVQPALAQIEVYHLEHPHTQIMFSVSHMGLSHSHGKFLKYSGTIILNHEDKTKSNVTATIKTASLEMNDPAWNDHLKGADFFDVEKFPDMTFKSHTVELKNDKAAIVTGDLTLHGVTKPVTLDVVFNKSMHAPYSNDFRAGFSATALIKRSEFGMTAGLPLVGDDVKIMIEVEAIREDDLKKER